MTEKLQLTVNGRHVTVVIEDDFELLCDVLRERLNLLGTKVGCREGSCGACNVLIDGEVARSCLVLASQVEGKSVTTIEGLGASSLVKALQRAFVETGAVQCGFCTPGIIVGLAGVLAEDQVVPDQVALRTTLSGNLCRCTGYGKIIEALTTVGMS